MSDKLLTILDKGPERENKGLVLQAQGKLAEAEAAFAKNRELEGKNK
jgi:hypothetical protein